MATLKIRDLTESERAAIREAVAEARHNWPNAHLGDIPPREDIRAAFKMIRERVLSGASVFEAAGAVLRNAIAHMDM